MSTSLSKDHRKLLEKVTARRPASWRSRLAGPRWKTSRCMRRSIAPIWTSSSVCCAIVFVPVAAPLAMPATRRTGLQDIHHLSELAAYEHWHRLLFTRFLTENHLLITDEANGSVPVTLEECEELAPELGARDGLDLACRFASLTLPGVFRRDDPVLDLPIALNDQVELRKLLASSPIRSLPCRRCAWAGPINSGRPSARTRSTTPARRSVPTRLSPVTQLFTEDYMVEFLLHNTLGAWWAGKIGPIKAASEDEARAQAALTARMACPRSRGPICASCKTRRQRLGGPPQAPLTAGQNLQD